ncbi:MerR family transcriptional regulator [Jiella avicenniae]|uniref:Helix-turn-helix domain-containing protein n=1 Tax=Jiella avicenniae TaxID=2907202 RepID=A0A9X1T504_9HYPH|nr:helix-turn-helix domain-containing protein [Jiella avicenniae]MCE7028572.1 helix-turn-helix domain-containing protein [Jiella avicenniae]
MAFSIGELSRRAGVKVPTIRYYEAAGLMPPAPRSDGGQRRYGRADAERLTFIRHARELGFEPEAIRELLDLTAHPEQSCATIDAIAARHLREVERRIASLGRLRDELARMIGECGHGRIGDCRVVETLADHAHCAGEHP